MPSTDAKFHKTQPPLASHPLPRRASPANSVTLQNHRLAREASLQGGRGSAPPYPSHVTTLPRRNSSGESHNAGQSDAKKWFNRSNQNPAATFDGGSMDVDPPFFQKESDSSNEDNPFLYQQTVPPKLPTANSSSAGDYRSVIDDLTVEIQKLKEELKRYKQHGPDMLRKDKLFEIKFHGLPKRKRRELEATLLDFTAKLGGSTNASSSQPKQSSRHANRDKIYPGSGSLSKRASSSSGSNIRPVDSAYASMSTGANSIGTCLKPPFTSSRSDQKVENYLRDIPEGLYPRYMVMTEKERKKLVVRRLERIFTGKFVGRPVHRKQSSRTPGKGNTPLAPVLSEIKSPQHPPSAPPSNAVPEPAREARILPHEIQTGNAGEKSRCNDMGSVSNSNCDKTESGGNGNRCGTGTSSSLPMPPPPEQRPTRPNDLDPDRIQIPSENMEYIRHLGLFPPEPLPLSSHHVTDIVYPDAEGWVYLNLLCNMAQVHMMNVTPDFVRSAVSDLSAKFQLSPDGRKIRWRGGSEGTKFSSDSSGDNSLRSPETDDTGNGKEDQCKRQKTSRSTGDSFRSGSSSLQASGTPESFHYKPLFLHRNSSLEQSSVGDDSLSSIGPMEYSNGDSRWDQSGSGVSNRRKRRRDGAIIYYNGAPFCTDLCGDSGDASPVTYMMSRGQLHSEPPTQYDSPLLFRSESGSCLERRPLSDMHLGIGSDTRTEDSITDRPELVVGSGDESNELNLEFPWSDEKQSLEAHSLEPCGISGVLPEDHFMVVVTTKRRKLDANRSQSTKIRRTLSEEITDSVANRLATMMTSLPRSLIQRPSLNVDLSGIEIEYISGRIRRLAPVPLPPPAIFFPTFSVDSWSDDAFRTEGDDVPSTEELMSRRVNPHQSDDCPDGIDSSSCYEDGQVSEDEKKYAPAYGEQDNDDEVLNDEELCGVLPSNGSTEAAVGTACGRSTSAGVERAISTGASSSGTASDGEDGYSSSIKDSS